MKSERRRDRTPASVRHRSHCYSHAQGRAPRQLLQTVPVAPTMPASTVPLTTSLLVTALLQATQLLNSSQLVASRSALPAKLSPNSLGESVRRACDAASQRTIISHGSHIPAGGASSHSRHSDCVCLALAFGLPTRRTMPAPLLPCRALFVPLLVRLSPGFAALFAFYLHCSSALILGRWSPACRCAAPLLHACGVAVRVSGAIAWPGARSVRNAHQQMSKLPACQQSSSVSDVSA